jgi:hypothetical protein
MRLLIFPASLILSSCGFLGWCGRWDVVRLIVFFLDRNGVARRLLGRLYVCNPRRLESDDERGEERRAGQGRAGKKQEWGGGERRGSGRGAGRPECFFYSISSSHAAGPVVTSHEHTRPADKLWSASVIEYQRAERGNSMHWSW